MQVYQDYFLHVYVGALKKPISILLILSVSYYKNY